MRTPPANSLAGGPCLYISPAATLVYPWSEGQFGIDLLPQTAGTAAIWCKWAGFQFETAHLSTSRGSRPVNSAGGCCLNNTSACNRTRLGSARSGGTEQRDLASLPPSAAVTTGRCA